MKIFLDTLVATVFDRTRRGFAFVRTGRAASLSGLIYGGGLRVSECVRLRVKDLDFDQGILFVREGKGDKDRSTLLPSCLSGQLKTHLERVKALHDKELAEGHGDVELPYSLAIKYPKAGLEWAWQYVFPAKERSVDPRSGTVRRHHVGEEVLQRMMRQALIRFGIPKHTGVHTLRHSSARRAHVKNRLSPFSTLCTAIAGLPGPSCGLEMYGFCICRQPRVSPNNAQGKDTESTEEMQIRRTGCAGEGFAWFAWLISIVLLAISSTSGFCLRR